MRGYRARQFLRWNEILYGGSFPKEMSRVWKYLYIKVMKVRKKG